MRSDVRRLWDRGFFDDVQVDLYHPLDQIHLRVLVRERPSVAIIESEGNKVVGDEDLQEIAKKDIKIGSITQPAAIRRTLQRIRDKYAEEGYFLAEAKHEVTRQKNNEIALRFIIKENEKVTVRRITFVGNHSIPASELKDLMLTGEEDSPSSCSP